jgi:hypothetical protein
MRNRLVSVMAATAAVLLLVSTLEAAQGQRQGGRGNAAPAAPDTRPFDPHDLSGFWLRERPDPNETSTVHAGQAMMKGRLFVIPQSLE